MKRNLILATSLVAVLLGAAAVPSFAQDAAGGFNPPRYADRQAATNGNGPMNGGQGQFAGQNNVGPRGDMMAMRGQGNGQTGGNMQPRPDCDQTGPHGPVGDRGPAFGPGNGRTDGRQAAGPQQGFERGHMGGRMMAMRGNDDRPAYGQGMTAGRQGAGPQRGFDRDDMRGGGRGPGIMANFQQYDTNGDGFISQEEFQVFVEETGRPVIEGHFQAMDANGDGKIAGTELPGRAAPMNQAPQFQQGQPGTPNAPRGMGGPVQQN